MFRLRVQTAAARPALLALATAALLLSPLSPAPGVAPARALAEEDTFTGAASMTPAELWLAQADATPEDDEPRDAAEGSGSESDDADAAGDAEEADAASDASADEEAADEAAPGRKSVRRMFILARRLAAMEVAVGIRGEQFEVWRDFTDALIAAVPDYDRRGRGGPRGEARREGGPAPGPKPEMKPTDRIRRMAQAMVERGAKAVTLLNALDALKAKLTPEQLERFGQFERMLMHRGQAGRKHGKGRHGGRHHMHGKHGYGGHKSHRYGGKGRHDCPHHGRGEGGGGKYACPHHGKKARHHGGMHQGPRGEGRGMGRGMGPGMRDGMGPGRGEGMRMGRGGDAGGPPRDGERPAEPLSGEPVPETAPDASGDAAPNAVKPDDTRAPEVIRPDESLPRDATAPPAETPAAPTEPKGTRDL